MSLERSNNANEMELRERKGKGLDSWALALLNKGLITRDIYDDFIEQDTHKEENIAKRGLPGYINYGYFSSVDEIREKLKPFGKERFVIRAISKKNGEKTRLRNATYEEVCRFAEKLAGGIGEWNVQVKEFPITALSGTIIVRPSGKTLIETWKGAHYLNPGNVPIYKGEFDPENRTDKFIQKFYWSAPKGKKDLAKFQEPAIKALRYIFPHLKPRPNEPIYAEYGVKPDGDIYFIEVSDSPLLTADPDGTMELKLDSKYDKYNLERPNSGA